MHHLRVPRFGLALVLLVIALCWLGCRRSADKAGDRTPPIPTAPARYGPPRGSAAQQIPRCRPSPVENPGWSNASFYVIQTELSPATLVHSATRYLGLFTGMTNEGLGAPTFVAWSTMNGPRSFRRGEKLDVTKMEENWVVVWWAGAEGWTN